MNTVFVDFLKELRYWCKKYKIKTITFNEDGKFEVKEQYGATSTYSLYSSGALLSNGRKELTPCPFCLIHRKAGYQVTTCEDCCGSGYIKS